jgi:hypothetical protein
MTFPFASIQRSPDAKLTKHTLPVVWKWAVGSGVSMSTLPPFITVSNGSIEELLSLPLNELIYSPSFSKL